MSCKFNRFNLPNEIKNKIGKPLKEEISNSLYQDFLKLNWFNLPVKLNNIFKKLLLEKPECIGILYSKFIWFSLNKKAEILCQIKDSILNCEPEYNFDITANWSGIDEYPVTSQESFITFLNERAYLTGSDLQNINIIDFNLENNRLTCNLTAEGTHLDLSAINIENFNGCGSISGELDITLNENNLVEFNPSIPLPLETIVLDITENSLISFNISIPLPNNLQTIYLGNNQLESFNPTVSLPISLQTLYLADNLLTNVSYTEAEEWAMNQQPFTNECTVSFSNNIDSITGTNLEAILLTKNCIIVP